MLKCYTSPLSNPAFNKKPHYLKIMYFYTLSRSQYVLNPASGLGDSFQ